MSFSNMGDLVRAIQRCGELEDALEARRTVLLTELGQDPELPFTMSPTPAQITVQEDDEFRRLVDTSRDAQQEAEELLDSLLKDRLPTVLSKLGYRRG